MFSEFLFQPPSPTVLEEPFGRQTLRLHCVCLTVQCAMLFFPILSSSSTVLRSHRERMNDPTGYRRPKMVHLDHVRAPFWLGSREDRLPVAVLTVFLCFLLFIYIVCQELLRLKFATPRARDMYGRWRCRKRHLCLAARTCHYVTDY